MGRSSRSPRRPDKAIAIWHRRNPRPAVQRGRRRALFALVVGRPVDRAGAWLGRVRGAARGRGGDGPPRQAAPTARPISRCSRPLPTCSIPRTASAQSRAVFAYDERLRLLPDYLQQLEMESNGKSVTADGKPLGRPSAPVTWGGVGTDAQHAVFQLLHQGTTAVPVEFVAVIENEDSVDPRHHQLLLGNCFAQGAALMAGREHEDPARAYPGDRPSIDHPAAAARCPLARCADRLLRAPHVRQCGVAGHQPVRPVRGRARQGHGASARRSGRASQARSVDRDLIASCNLMKGHGRCEAAIRPLRNR